MIRNMSFVTSDKHVAVYFYLYLSLVMAYFISGVIVKEFSLNCLQYANSIISNDKFDKSHVEPL